VLEIVGVVAVGIKGKYYRPTSTLTRISRFERAVDVGIPMAGEIARQDWAIQFSAQIAPRTLWPLGQMIVWHEGQVREAVCHMRAIPYMRIAQQKAGGMRKASIDLLEKARVFAYDAISLEILQTCITGEVAIAWREVAESMGRGLASHTTDELTSYFRKKVRP